MSVPDSPQKVCPLLAGMAAPSIRMRTAEGEEFDLAAAAREKPAVVVFYRGGW